MSDTKSGDAAESQPAAADDGAMTVDEVWERAEKRINDINPCT